MDKKRTEFIGIRLSEKEAEMLRERTAAKRISASAYVRDLLIDDVQGKEKALSPAALSDKRLSTAMAIKTRFKKTASQYGLIANLLQQSLKQAVESGGVISNPDDVVRSFRSLENITVELQKSVNEYLSIEGVKQELPVYRRTLPETAGKGHKKIDLSKFTYMEKIQIIGSVGSDMQTYKDKFGNEKVKIGVTSQAGKSERKYVVFALRSRLPEAVPVGTVLFAMGDFEIQENGVVAIFADTVKVM